MDDFFKSKKALQTLKLISPGTELRLGIDHVLKAKTGGLIVIADNEDVSDIDIEITNKKYFLKGKKKRWKL